jgi:glutathione S-transferase
MLHYTALVSLLAVLFYVYLGTRVATARRTFNVPLPAMTGHPEFERINRVHLNTLEWMPVFLVPLWLCAFYLSDVAAAALGLVWIVGRIMYFTGYREAADKRHIGFLVQGVACLLLLIGALAGIVMFWLR